MSFRAARSGVALPLLLLLFAAPDAGCSEEWTTFAGRTPLEARLVLQREDGRVARAFAPGEALALVLTLRNPSGAPQSVALPSAQTHDFAVSTLDGREVWRWSGGRMFAQMLSELSLAPGEERSFREGWNPRRPDGAPIAPGRYRAEAWVGPGAAGLRVESVEFVIESGEGGE